MDRKETASKINNNRHLVHVFSVEDLIAEWNWRTGTGNYPLGMDNVTLTTTALDVGSVAKIIGELGLRGEVMTKDLNGKQYALVKTAAGERKILTNTKYLARSPKIVDMGLGKIGAATSMVKGAFYAFVLYVGLNVLEHLLNDNSTKAKLFGTLASDVTKLAISSSIGAVAGKAAGAYVTLAFGPLVIAVGVGILVGWALSKVDEHYGLTDALVKGLDSYERRFSRGFSAFIREFEWRIMNGRVFY